MADLIPQTNFIIVCWNAFQKGHYSLTLAIAIFTLCAIAITLSAIGTKKITWDESGITVRKFPAAPKHIQWNQIEKMRVDHLGYHIRSKRAQFKISTKNMPDSLLNELRKNIRKNTKH